jgi:hypothetical protein
MKKQSRDKADLVNELLQEAINQPGRVSLRDKCIARSGLPRLWARRSSLRKIAMTGPDDGEEKVPKCNSLRDIYHFDTNRFRRDLNHAFGVEPNSIMRHRFTRKSFFPGFFVVNFDSFLRISDQSRKEDADLQTLRDKNCAASTLLLAPQVQMSSHFFPESHTEWLDVGALHGVGRPPEAIVNHHDLGKGVRWALAIEVSAALSVYAICHFLF